MCSKKGILYGVYHDWTEEISVVYEMDKEGYFPENKFEGEIENGQPNGNGNGIWTQCDALPVKKSKKPLSSS